MPEFIRGLALNEAFYVAVVAPLLQARFPSLVYSIGRVGRGSDVLGYDTEMSTDHDWGPRLEMFVAQTDVGMAGEISDFLAARLPRVFLGYPVGFTAPDPSDNGTQLMDFGTATGPVNHRVSVQTVRHFLERHLGIDPRPQPTAADWLSFSEQSLLEVTGGAVFHDGLGEIGSVRAALSYYPHDVWLFRLAAQWRRLSQEEPFVGRCGSVGDELGSRVVAARLVRDLMRLCFLLERRYAPYSKWLGTGFAKLACADRMQPLLLDVLRSETWLERERLLGEAASLAAEMQNRLRIAPPVSTEVRPFFSRPFRVIGADRLAGALLAQISDPWLKTIALAGGVDQYCDSTDLVSEPALAQRLRAVYRP